MRPTFKPRLDNATARLAATVLLPTPPLPDSTTLPFAAVALDVDVNEAGLFVLLLIGFVLFFLGG